MTVSANKSSINKQYEYVVIRVSTTMQELEQKAIKYATNASNVWMFSYFKTKKWMTKKILQRYLRHIIRSHGKGSKWLSLLYSEHER